ncbi:MAG: hypothetical protein JNJ70_00690 [Verrucomicrobiales bacterium]|nr:hypothetical protein [Verrucomicrobiales bacterium]
MNTWGYLLLIAALLLLAGVMLYARFSTRSREKSLHHAPVDWEFSPTVISSAPFAGGSEPIAPLPSSDVEIESEPVLRLERPAPASPVAEASRDRDYLDDLQEAAAGLAKLMRSSPVARVEPVVFAPEESPAEIAEVTGFEEALEEIVAEEIVAEEIVAEEIVAEEIVAEEIVAEEIVAEEIVADEIVAKEIVAEEIVAEEIVAEEIVAEEIVAEEIVAEEIVAEEIVAEEIVAEEIVAEEIVAEEIVAEEIVAEEILPAVAPVEAPKVVSLRELLGDAVADQFDRIDEGLDALESLVTGIETSLRLLADLERPDLGDEAYEGDEESVAAAA